VAHRGEHAPPGPQRRISGVPELLVSADRLLYQAKQSGRNAVAFQADGAVALAGMAAHRRAGPGR
ncbi:MAG: GGDEF domain-containing protein, partial [Dehalococcoidia bacterium]